LGQILSLSETSLINDLRGPPRAFFSFARPIRPHGLARVGPALRPGAFLVSMSASFNSARSAALSFLEGIMAQVPGISKIYVEKMQNVRNFGRLARPVADRFVLDFVTDGAPAKASLHA
jgi:hypothetical protein